VSGFVVWFTGLSGSGKSTLGAMLAAELRHRGLPVEVLDGDEVRTHLSKGLGFSREDRDTNVRRIGFVAKLIARSGGCAITAAISPYRALRDEQRAATGRFVEVYCRCPVLVLAERDVKGLYKKALAGEIKHFTGVDDPYEEPDHPEVTVDTSAESREESLHRILARLEELGYVPALGSAGERPQARRGLVTPHGGDLVDRFVPASERDALAEQARQLPVIDLDALAESDVESLATGAFSPLKGFMGSKDYLRVVRSMRLESGLPWPVPVTLAVPRAQVDRVVVGSRIALRTRDGRRCAVLDVADAWTPEPSGDLHVGGELRVFERPRARAFPGYHHDPRETRAVFAERGWSRVIGFHTERPMLRAQEYVTKAALEIGDGLLIHAGGGGDAAVRIRGYEALLRGYYPEGRALVSIYAAAARGADPREAVLRAIVQKNHGVSHVVVEGDQEEARRLFDDLAPGELGVQPLCFEEAFFSRITLGMATAKTAPGDASTRVGLTAAELQAMLARGELPPPEVVRPEVARILLEEARNRGA
jgi:adenylyl-sulfate kinase